MCITKTIIKIWMLIALLLVATTGYAQKTIIQKSNADYSLTSKLSFSGSNLVDTQGADKDGYNEASYRVFEGVLSPNEPLKIQCSASCLNGKKKAAYKIRISIWFTKENGSEVKSPVNGGGVKTSQDQPLSVSCKIPKEATYANATIEVKGALGTGVDPSTLCHLIYKIQGRDGSQSKNSGNANKQTSTSKRPSWWKEREPEPISRCDHPLSGISINDLCGEVHVRCNADEDDSDEFAELDGLIREEDRIRTKEESKVILGLEDMNTYIIRPNSIVVIRTEKNKQVKYLTREEIKEILKTNKEIKNEKTSRKLEALICFMFNTGSRVNEVTKLKIKDITTDETGKYQIIINGKGNNTAVLGINEDTVNKINTMLEDRPNAKPNDPLFIGRGGGSLKERTIQKHFKELAKATDERLTKETGKTPNL